MSNKPYTAPSVILPHEPGQIVDLKNFRPNPIVLFFPEQYIRVAQGSQRLH